MCTATCCQPLHIVIGLLHDCSPLELWPLCVIVAEGNPTDTYLPCGHRASTPYDLDVGFTHRHPAQDGS